mmetsp:Transcript_20804/g.59390  ORF Transcript_20804/g.59390 Transcript_20804/m.59390 type:complete len:363 (+) Transcript_20804:818-1906(+)
MRGSVAKFDTLGSTRARAAAPQRRARPRAHVPAAPAQSQREATGRSSDRPTLAQGGKVVCRVRVKRGEPVRGVYHRVGGALEGAARDPIEARLDACGDVLAARDQAEAGELRPRRGGAGLVGRRCHLAAEVPAVQRERIALGARTLQRERRRRVEAAAPATLAATALLPTPEALALGRTPREASAGAAAVLVCIGTDLGHRRLGRCSRRGLRSRRGRRRHRRGRSFAIVEEAVQPPLLVNLEEGPDWVCRREDRNDRHLVPRERVLRPQLGLVGALVGTRLDGLGDLTSQRRAAEAAGRAWRAVLAPLLSEGLLRVLCRGETHEAVVDGAAKLPLVVHDGRSRCGGRGHDDGEGAGLVKHDD